jgi:PAS domain S-box-containing protein
MLKTLRGKFTLVYVGLALIAALVGATGLWNLYRLEKSVNNLMTKNYDSIDAVSHMMEAVERQDSGMLVLMDIDRQSGIDTFVNYNRIFLSNFDFEKGNITENGEAEAVDMLQKDYSDYSKMIFTLQDKLSESDTAAHTYYSDTVEPLFIKIKADCWDIININRDAMFAGKQATTDSARQSMLTLLVLSLAAIVLGYVISRYFILRFLRPLRDLSESIARVREGDLYQQVSIRANDETGKLAREFNEMTVRLRDYEQSSVGTLMAEKNKSLAIVRSISDPLIVLDANWRILLVNDAFAEFFGLDGSEAAGRHFLEAVHDGELFQCIESLAGGGERRGKIVRLRRDGEHYFNLIATKINAPDAMGSGMIVAFQNVTGLKELERVRTDFIATISHEFKTPLTSILMAASMLREGGMGGLNPEQTETAQAIGEEGERLLALVNDLLELMKMESGREAYKMEPCGVDAIVEASLHGFAEIARARGIDLVDNLGPCLPNVLADAEKIRWVMNNLIGNALKYTGAGDSVTVTASHDDDFVYISVRDTGAGIPPEYLDGIFGNFAPAGGTDIEVSGTGLGLSLSREIVRAHSGSIKAESELGEGSVFTFSLRIAKEE